MSKRQKLAALGMGLIVVGQVLMVISLIMGGFK